MSCLGCEKCETAETVKLTDGRIVCNTCEDYRAECEARHVCGLPYLEQRRGYMADIEKRRGKEAADALRILVKQEWEHRDGK